MRASQMGSIRAMFSHPRSDAIAGAVVFLVAVPLCLGIALASGVSPVSGLVAGVVGGIVVPFLSRSPLSVTGPAAGLTAVVLFETRALGSFERLLTATMIGGCLQILLGVLRTGRFAALVPDSVVKGMLAAIGIIIVWNQLSAMVGGEGGVAQMAAQFAAGPAVIAAVSLLVLYGWGVMPLARHAFLPPALVVVVVSMGLAFAFAGMPGLALTASQCVDVPLGGWSALREALPVPDMGALADPLVWRVAVTVALVASIETLLSLKAIDGIDPLKRISPPNQELFAQGVANLASGWLGGLPVTAVIVRSGANLQAGGRERLSALVHGVLLLLAVLFAGRVLIMIPLACLAAVLVQVGLKLASPKLFLEAWRLGWPRFLPFMATIAAVLATDLLKGVVVGIALELTLRIVVGQRRACPTHANESGVEGHTRAAESSGP
jgi:MFS superfamily sulfate permease-like transporter